MVAFADDVWSARQRFAQQRPVDSLGHQTKTNDELRNEFVTEMVEQFNAIGLTVPDPDMVYDAERTMDSRPHRLGRILAGSAATAR